MTCCSREEPHDDQEFSRIPPLRMPDGVYPVARPAVAFSRQRRPHDDVCGRGPSLDGNGSEYRSGPSSNTDWPGRRAGEPGRQNWPGMSEERKERSPGPALI